MMDMLGDDQAKMLKVDFPGMKIICPDSQEETSIKRCAKTDENCKEKYIFSRFANYIIRRAINSTQSRVCNLEQYVLKQS